MSRPDPPYDILAPVYDHWQESFERPYNDEVSAMLRQELSSHRLKKGSFLDIGCGTGTVALRMAKRGWETFGLDGSTEMLNRARKRAEEQGLHAVFLHEYFEHITIDRTFTVIGSFYDCLNHIVSKRELKKLLAWVGRHLETDGLFIFDVNTLSCYRSLWNSTSIGHHEEYTLILENKYRESSRRARSVVTVFRKHSPGTYRKYSTVIEERWYPREELQTCIENAGMVVKKIENVRLFAHDGDDSYKTWWVCRAQK